MKTILTLTIGRRLTLNAVQKAVPVVSGAIGALFDAGQMRRVVDYADIFYAKRFILEKEARIGMLGIADEEDGSDCGEAMLVAIEDAPPAPVCDNGNMLKGAWKVAEKTAAAILDGDENSVYSPACIYEGLRVTRLGAGGETAAELDALIGRDAPDGDWLGLERVDDLSYEDYVARLAAGVWVDEKASPCGEFADACERGSIPVTVTRLSEPCAAEEVSRWISEQTEGLLSPSIDLDPQALACVASSLYLRDAWENGFPEDATELGPFHADGGDVDACFMVNEAELPLSDTEAGTLVGCPLSNGATMVLLLPKEGVPLGDMVSDGSAIRAMADFTPVPTAVELHLPKFTCETTVADMAAALKAAGFGSADNPDLFPMTGMAETPASYVHGAKVTVDENGLEAGAYFAMVACTGALPEIWEPPVPHIIVLDRPFAYAIISRTGQPLFVGIVARPEA